MAVALIWKDGNVEMTTLGLRLTAMVLALLYVLTLLPAQLAQFTEQERTEVREHLKTAPYVEYQVRDLSKRLDRLEELNLQLRVDRLEQAAVQREKTNQLLFALLIPVLLLSADKIVDWVGRIRRYHTGEPGTGKKQHF
jgi:hypothetical protein